MADSLVRLKINSEEYDQKLKRATEGLQRYVDGCRKIGGTLEAVEKDTLDYVKALGQMDTVSRTATGKLAEMKKAFTELSVQYKQLTDEEKQSPFGQALASSLDQLKSRCNEAKQNLNSVNAELGNTKEAEDNTKSGIEGLTSALGINLKSLVGWGAALGAAKGALDVAKDAFFASEQNLDDWNRTVYSAESVYQGFLTALNTGDISGFLDNINTIVKAASEAYNALDRLGTMKTIDTPQLTAKQSEIQRMQTMLRSGRWIDRADGVKSALGYKTGDILPKEVLDNIAQQLKSAMNEVAGIMKQELGAANTAIDALYKEQAVQLGMSNEQFRKGTASMAVFEENLKKAQKYLDFEREHTTSVTSTGSNGLPTTTTVRDNVANPYEQYKGWSVFKDDGDLYQRIIQEIRNRGAAENQYYSQVGQAYRGINRVEGVKVGGGGGTGTSPQEQAQKQVDAALLAYNQTIDKARLEMESGLKNEADMKKAMLSGQERLYDAYGKAYDTYADPRYKEAQDAAAAEIVKLGGEVKASSEAQKKAQEAARALETAQNKLADAQLKLAEAQESGDLKQIYSAEKNVQNAQKGVDLAQANLDSLSQSITVEVMPKWAESALNALPQEIKDKLSGKTDVPIPLTTANLDAFIANTKEQIASSDLGSGVVAKLQESLSDATAIGEIMKTALKNGIDTADFSTTGLMQKLMNGEDIDDATIQSYVDALNAKLKEKFDETEWPKVLIKFDINSKEISNIANGLKNDSNKLAASWSAAASAVSSVGSALNSIEDPSIKAMGTVIQSIASIALGFAQASVQASSLGPWGWVAFLAAGLAAVTTTVSTIHSLTGYANGGIVDGRNGGFVGGMSYSGDNVGNVRLNSGELVLNHAQQNNLANELEGGTDLKNLKLTTEVSGEDIRFVLAANNQIHGLGDTIEFGVI